MHFQSCAERAFTANDDQGIELILAPVIPNPLGYFIGLQRIDPRCAEYRATARENT
jgi:hypothetical protein